MADTFWPVASSLRWQRHAACVEHPEVNFFPEVRPGRDSRLAQRAKAICQECPVVADCLAYALEFEIGFGVWGGTTPEERRSMRRRS